MPKRSAFHRCFAPDCQKDVPNNHLMCFHHWKRLPAHMQTEIVEQWKYGLKNKCHPTQAYLFAIGSAQTLLREQDAKRLAKHDAHNFSLAGA